MPHSAFTISPSAQNAIPSPYGRQRPCRQVTSSGRSSMCWNSSAARRLLPTPGSPTMVTSWQERCWAERSNVPISSAFSSSLPTSGVACVRVTSEPNRARAASGR